MWQTYRRRCIACLLWCVAVSVGISISLVGCKKSQPVVNSRQQEMEEIETAEIQIDPGNEPKAFSYYKETFDELGLNPQGLSGQALVDSQSLSLALKFLGYEGLKPKEAEDLPSAELRKRFPDTLLASAFFAPKITDVSQSEGGTGGKKINPGWRKVIRLKAQKDSDAERKGIASGFLLFNKFQGEKYELDPMKPRADKSNESQNTQLILVRAETSALRRPIYFLVFGPISAGGKLITFLTASFDARDPDIVPGGKYFVPNACAECHGGKIFSEEDFQKLKLNYLDSDHWFDRLGDDFAFLQNASFTYDVPLYDGEKDPAKFETAFRVVQSLNEEIKEQNRRVEPNPSQPSFQLRAVTKWLDLHASDFRHQNLFARALPNDSGPQWADDPSKPDKQLLPLLNQYCYRCHSSVLYSILDRPEVVRLRRRILRRLHLTPVTESERMPQDRNLDCSPKTLEDKRKIHELVCALNPDEPCPTPTPLPSEPCPTPTP